MELEAEHHDALEKLSIATKKIATERKPTTAKKAAVSKKKTTPKSTASKPKSTKSSKTTSSKAKSKSAQTGKDDLTEIVGIGPVIQKKLIRNGIKTFEQIAGWTQKDAQAIDEKLAFKDRVKREEWVKQAKALVRAKARENKKK